MVMCRQRASDHHCRFWCIASPTSTTRIRYAFFIFSLQVFAVSHASKTSMRRHVLSQNTATKCFSDDKSCTMNPMMFRTLSSPQTLGGRFLYFIGGVAENCSKITSESECVKSTPCSWIRPAQLCSIRQETITQLAPAAMVCPSSDALNQLICSAVHGSQPNCNTQAGCTWTSSGCLLSQLANSSVVQQQEWLAGFHNFDKKIWGLCDGTDVVQRLLNSCAHVDSTSCLADASCHWASGAEYPGCSLKPAYYVRLLVVSDETSRKIVTDTQDMCSNLPVGDKCAAAGSFEVPAAPSEDYMQQFGHLLQPSNILIELPGHQGPTSLETVRTLQFVQLDTSSSASSCLPVNVQGLLAYEECLQLRLKMGSSLRPDGTRSLELMPVADKSELNCPCVFKFSGAMASNGANATLRLAPNTAPGQAAADAYISAHPALGKVCVAQMSQAPEGQSMIISYKGGNHSVDIKAGANAHHTLTVDGCYALLLDNTGCALQFKVTEHGVPDLLRQPAAQPAGPPAPAPAQSQSASTSGSPDSKPLSTIQLMSYKGLRKGTEEQCLPVNKHGFSPYASCFHMHIQSMPSSSNLPRTLKVYPDEGLSQYFCPCLVQMTGSYTDETEMKAELHWSSLADSKLSWNVSEYLREHPEMVETCTAATQTHDVSLDFTASGDFHVNVPQAGQSTTITLERQGPTILLTQSNGCVMEFMINLEDTPQQPSEETKLGPSALQAVEQLNFVGLQSSLQHNCLPVNSELYSPMQDCLNWVVNTEGPENRQIRLTPTKGTSEFGCPCLLSMYGSISNTAGDEATVTFQPMDWSTMAWDVAAYMAQEPESQEQCSVTMELQQGESSALNISYSGNGNYTVNPGSPAVRFTLRRDQGTATMVANGCVLMFEVRDSRPPAVDPAPKPQPSWIPEPTGAGFNDYDYLDYDSLIPPQPPSAPSPEPEQRTTLDGIQEVHFSQVVLNDMEHCLPTNAEGASPLQDCYNFEMHVNATHVELAPALSTSELGCPCLFRLVGPISDVGQATAAEVVYKEMDWGPQWDVAEYVQRWPDLAPLCSSTLRQPHPAQQLNFQFQTSAPYYKADITNQDLPWQFQLRRAGPRITLQDRNHCMLSFLITKERKSASEATTPDYTGPTLPEDKKPSHARHHKPSIAAFVVLGVVISATILSAVSYTVYRNYVTNLREDNGYDPLESAEMAELDGSSMQDKVTFQGTYRQI